MIWLLRLVLLFFIFSLFYYTIKFLLKPKRKLESARKHKRFLLLDHEEAIKNFQLTYNGAVFIGEKYMGATKNKIDVVSISLWPETATLLKGLAKEDIYYIEGKIREKYPEARIDWKSPIHELLQQK